MLRGLYTATNAMLAQSRRMDVITNNLVNVETAGFKSDTMTTRSFQDMLISRIYDPSVYQYKQVGPLNMGVHVDQIFTEFSSGSFENTRHPCDIAIVGEGFFVVDWFPRFIDEDDEFDIEPEERFTRAGNFSIDGEGNLVTPNGYFVHGENGTPIHIGTTDFTVESDGTILVGGEEIDRLRIVTFEDPRVLRKQGETLYTIFGTYDEWGDFVPSAEPEDIEPEVRQGFLEASNVDIAKETVRMMETHRSYEINQRVINMFDETLRLSVNEIARF
jgi:flagellar basal-body rod protein FlgG